MGDVTWGLHLWWMKSSFSPWFPSVLEGGLEFGRISSQSYQLKIKLNLSPLTSRKYSLHRFLIKLHPTERVLDKAPPKSFPTIFFLLVLTDDAFWLQLCAGWRSRADSFVKMCWRGTKTLPYALSHHFRLFDKNCRGTEHAPRGRRMMSTQGLPHCGGKKMIT